MPAPIAQVRPELFFGLVRPTGYSGDDLRRALEAELSRVGYETAGTIKVSSLLHSLDCYASLKGALGVEDERIERHMNAGDDLRRKFSQNGVLAYFIAESIANHRPATAASRAWIIDSLKHPEEIELLRSLYGDNLIVLSIYADESVRRRDLARSIARSRGTNVNSEVIAQSLIFRDQQGADSSPDGIGQDVRRTFARGDYFVSTPHNVREQIARLIETLFGRPTRSPTRDEYGMAVARGAALRSADLSRQVGAVIVDGDGEVLVAGCNEVPKPGGGVYWEGDPQDSRDFVYECDPNEETSREMLVELFGRLEKHGWLSEEKSKLAPADLAATAMSSKILEGSRVTSLVEFGRIVHAEMNAVLRAAAGGIRIKGMRMICTTFPCHVCARHLLGAGLSEVVYIEPYPKSLAPEQYPNAIVVGDQAAPGLLRCKPFLGWSPSRYTRIFQFGRRKADSGYLSQWNAEDELPKTDRRDRMYKDVELGVSQTIDHLLAVAGISRI